MSKKFNERIAKNNAYYDTFAEQVAERIEARRFDKAFSLFLSDINKSDLILDVGSGSGAHLKYFQDHGFKAIGIEPSEKMRELASRLGVESVNGTFETIEKLKFENVAGVWCAASLLHVPKEDVPTCLANVSKILKPNGKIFLTVRLGEGAKWDKFDDQSADVERFIQLFCEDEIKSAVENSGFKIVESWVEDSYWGRPSKWISIVGKIS